MPGVLTLRRLLAALDEADIPALRLFGAVNDDQAPVIDLLIPRHLAGAAQVVLASADWRTEVGGLGLWRATRRASYSWDHGLVIHLHWGIPAAPLPSSALQRLEASLWHDATRGPLGVWEPTAAAGLVSAAVQAVRPAFDRRRWREEVATASRTVDDWSEVAKLASRAGVGGSVRRALVAAAVPLPVGLPRDGLVDRAWSAGRLIQRRVSNRRILAVIGGTPLLGRTTLRTRFAGLDLVVGPGVFQPMALSENLVTVTLARVADVKRPVLVEVGTGCGAVALALARARPDAEIHASDVSRAAVLTARYNRRRLAARCVRLYRGSLLRPFPGGLAGRVSAVVANLPYVPARLRQAAWKDTPRAIEGEDEDGLGLLRDFVRSLTPLRPGSSLILQLRVDQWEGFAGELGGLGYHPGDVVARSGESVVAWATRS